MRSLFFNCSGRKSLEQRTYQDDERIATLEQQLAEAQLIAEDSDRKYDEVNRSRSRQRQSSCVRCTFRLHVVLLSWKSIWNVLKIVPKPLKRKSWRDALIFLHDHRNEACCMSTSTGESGDTSKVIVSYACAC